MDAIRTATRALRAAVNAGRVPRGPTVDILATTDGLRVVVLNCDFPVVPREWTTWADAMPSERGEMPAPFTTQAQAFRDAVVAAIQPVLPGVTVTCDFAAAAANPAGAKTVTL
jgi:hypothetical protein